MNEKKVIRTPFFERVGGFVTKRYRIILMVWIILVSGAIYPAIRLSGILSYNEIDFLPENLEYQTGLTIYNEQFPSNSSGDTIIVIQSKNLITTEENLEYIRILTERIKQTYGNNISEIQSVLTLLEFYNNSYWNIINEALENYYDNLTATLTLANQEMWLQTITLTNLLQQIANIYLLSWFNFSRTYFYGLYNTTLFSSGPNATVYQQIFDYTNFSLGYAIQQAYVDLVYECVLNELPNPNLVNDSRLHDFSLHITNSSLFEFYSDEYEMTIQEYSQQIYPKLEIYYHNWTTFFYTLFTSVGESFVNGTHLSENLYNNTNLSFAFTSQQEVLSHLLLVNQTIFTELSFRDVIIQDTLELINFTNFYENIAKMLGSTPSEIEQLFNPYILPLMEAIYDLGENPTDTTINALANEMINIIISIVVILRPPPDNIDDIPFLLTRWVLSDNRRVSLILIRYNTFNKTSYEFDLMAKKIDYEIGIMAHELVEELNLEDIQVYHTGDVFILETWVMQAERDAQRIDIFTIVFVIIILLVIFTSFVAPIIPIVAIGASIAISMALLWFISFAMDIHFMATLFLTVTSLGAGVDYCIFIFSRYNEERKKGNTKEEAVKTAIKYAGESVFHSGLTVMVGFGALIIPNFPLLRILGISMCIGISVSICSAILVVPSIILLLGDAIWWPKFLQILLRPQQWGKKREIVSQPQEIHPDGQPIVTLKEQEPEEKKKERFLVRFANVITKNGLVITIVAVVIASPFTYFAITMDTSTDMLGMLPKDFEGTMGREILSNSFSVGDPTPIKVIFTNIEHEPLNYSVLLHTGRLCDELVRESKRDNKIATIKVIRTTVQPLGIKIPFTSPEAIEFYTDFIDPFIAEDGKTFFLEIYLDHSPYHSKTEKFIDKLPDFVESSIEQYNLWTLKDVDIYYVGLAQALYEIKRITDNAFPIVIPIVIIGVYLILFFLFGSYFTPIRLILTIALSIAFTLGLLSLVFSFGFGVPIFWLLPLMLFAILMGLGLDYDIFLVTRIKEYYDKGLSNKDAIAHALDHTATIITACGILMAAAYSTLMLSQLWHLRELGFAFSLAIILDATIIRLIIVPAVMVLMEKYNWKGPKRLMKRRHHCPNLETETKAIIEICNE